MTQVERSQTDGGAVDRQVDFKYDVYGNRIEKSYDADGAGGGGATVTRFAYDAWKNSNQYLVGNENWDVWADLNGSSSLTTRYIRGDVIDQIFSRIDSGTNYWELTDRLGSVREVINNSAVIKDTIGYNGFGGITSETDSSFRGRYAWTGREIDTEINLQYNRARYYDANTGRWISQDPLGFDAGDSNLYRYVSNQATYRVDPSGLEIFLDGTEVYAPIMGLQGAFAWGIAWSLTKPSDAQKGGYIIQHVRFDIRDSDNKDVFAQVFKGKINDWYEAWRVSPGATTPDESTMGAEPYVTNMINYVATVAGLVQNQQDPNKTTLQRHRQYLEGQRDAAKGKTVNDTYYSAETSVKPGNIVFKIKGRITIKGEANFYDCLTKADLLSVGFGSYPTFAENLLSLPTFGPFVGGVPFPIGAIAMSILAAKASSVSNTVQHDIAVKWDGTSKFVANTVTQLVGRPVLQ